MAAKKTKKKAAAAAADGVSKDAHFGKVGDKASRHPEAKVRKTYKKMLPVRVGQDKVEEAMKAMATLHHEREALKTEKRDALAKFRDKLNAIDEQTSRCVATIDNSTEDREVECVERFLPTGVMEFVRMDNQTLFEDSRAATMEERQDRLPGFDAPEDEDLPGPRSRATKKAKKE